MDASDIRLPAPGEFGDAPAEDAVPQSSVPAREDEILLAEGIDFNGAESFFTRELQPFDWVVEGLLATGTDCQRGFKGDLIAGSKGRKSFFAIQLGLCVAAGIDVCGYRVPKPRKVAYLNLELVPRGFQERVWKICETLNLDRAMLRRNFTPLTVPYPSRLRQNDVLGAFIRKLKDGGYSLVILDPLYKLYEIGEDECTGIGLSGVLRFRDRLITEARAAVLVVMHDAKGGSTGDRRITDRGAGSGFAGRDYDARMTLTPHADGDDTHVVLASSSRYRPKQPDRTIVFDPAGMVFRSSNEINPLQQTAATASETLNAEIRIRKSAADSRLADSVIGKMADDLGNRLVDLETFATRFKETTGWGINRSKSVVMAHAERNAVISATKEMRRHEDGSVGPILHSRTLIGQPSAVAAYLADLYREQDESEVGEEGCDDVIDVECH